MPDWGWLRRWNWLREARKLAPPAARPQPPELHPDTFTSLTPEERSAFREIEENLK